MHASELLFSYRLTYTISLGYQLEIHITLLCFSICSPANPVSVSLLVFYGE
jgi:hypothetical protein